MSDLVIQTQSHLRLEADSITRQYPEEITSQYFNHSSSWSQ